MRHKQIAALTYWTGEPMADLLTTSQVQDKLRVDRTTIYRMVEDGRLPAIRVGKQWRFQEDEIARWLQARGSTFPAPIGNGMTPTASAALVPVSVSTAAAGTPAPAHLSEILPLTCVQLIPVSYTHLRAHETRHDLVCR